MPAIRLSGARALMEELISPGDVALTGEAFNAVATVGATVLSATSLTSGSIYRSGSTGAYTDTFDTAVNMLAALAGNSPAGPVVPGHSFRCRLYNSVAFAETITLGAGMVAGNGTVASVAASTWRDFLFTVACVQPSFQLPATVTNGSAVVLFTLPPGLTAYQMGPAPTAIDLMPGASVSGTGIPANTTVLGITQGQGGIIGLTMSANATATGTNVALTFGPTIKVDSLGSGTL